MVRRAVRDRRAILVAGAFAGWLVASLDLRGAAPQAALSMVPVVGHTTEPLNLAVVGTPGTKAVEPFTPSEPPSAREVARRAVQATVAIRAGASYGSGTLIDRDGHVLTAHHVIESGEDIWASFPGARPQAATVVVADPALDLALLKVADVGGAEPLEVVSALALEPGDTVYAVGSPKEMDFTFSRGLVSYVGRRMDGRRFVQTDLPANPGSSGGPMLDAHGRLVAVMTFVLRDSEGLAFALPVDNAFMRFAGVLPVHGELDLAAFRAWADDEPLQAAR